MLEQFRRRFARPVRFLRNRLSPEGYLGLHLTVGMVVIILGCCWFGGIVEDLGTNEPLVALDARLAQWFHEHGTHDLTSAARIVTFFGSVGFLTAASVSFALAFALRRAWGRFLVLVLTVGGGSLLNIVLKHAFHRQRPVLENPLVTLSSYGFPSGHTMGATIFYGLMALLAVRRLKRWWQRALVFAVAAVVILSIALSRIYLGAHYLSDILGALAAGLVWLALCWTGVETFRKRRAFFKAGGGSN
jgi:undecaprenyl-diphosphatase